MKQTKIHKLSQEVINQIAAGEVVERPSSVVKELVDNSIDAQATRIEIKVRGGGIDSIEVSDNGIGIPKENMDLVFDAHTTSKIQNIEDLNNLLSMGFRGEALSTITSVSKVTLTSKYTEEDFGNTISYDENGKSDVKKSPKEEGTVVKVENLFFNIPARRKYLKTAQTEYRKIYELLTNFFLIYPNIHFILEKDGKEVENLPVVEGYKPGEITKERVAEVLGNKEKLLKLFFEGFGMKISGYIDHPNAHKSSRPKSYIFVNNRAITEKGVVRAVYEGYSRFLPFGQKIDFVINISMKPELVDVNVHPRKEEVRFENPYRMYSAVENAVKHVLEKEFSFESTKSSSIEQTKNFSSLRDTFNQSSNKSQSYQPSNVCLGGKPSSVNETLLFSKEALRDIPEDTYTTNDESEKPSDIVNIFQIFKKYIVIELANEQLWILDQHAAAERINFEKISQKNKNNLDLQNYLVPIVLELKKEETLFLEEEQDFFKDLGIIYEIKNNSVELKTIPSVFSEADFAKVFEEIFAIEDDINVLKKNFKKLKEDILATIACHTSIRSGQKLQREEMLNLFKELFECKNPYSCPHGRPIVWKMSLSQLDHNFERTY